MLNEVAAIVESYETLGMTPEEIAEDRNGLDIVAVKAALMQHSHKYKVACKGEHAAGEDVRLNFDDDDLMAANEVIRNIAKHGESEDLKLKAAMYIRDDKKGRKNPVKVVGGNQFNLFDFNTQLKAVRDGANEIKHQLLDASTGQPV